jgi:predicted transcriptional regulator YdeE
MKTNLETFYIIGLSVRTSNENNQAATDIPALWERFTAEGISSKVTNKLSEEIYSLYTDYEKDHTKPYTTVLGYKVKDLNAIPEGLTGAIVPGKNFEVFTAFGKLSDGIVYKQWIDIWNMPLNRAYSGDFEIYGAKAQNPEQAEVDIYIALN